MIVLGGLAWTAFAQQKAPKWMEKQKKAVVSITTYKADGTTLHNGTGFFIAEDGKLLSAYSLFKGADKAIVTDTNGKTYPVSRVLAADELYDVIKLQVEIPKKVSYLEMAEAPLNVNAPAYLLPFVKDKGKVKSFGNGKVEEVTKLKDTYHYYKLSFPLQVGWTNAPVCNEEDYVIVWNCSYENGRRINKAMITVEEEANHTLSGWVRDICGQESTVQTAECTYDTTPPSVQIRVWGEEYFIPYKTYQYFGREPFTVSVTAKDKISGVQTISCRYHGEKVPETDGAPVLYENENIKEKSGDLSEYQVEFSVLQEDFKGKISVQAADLTGWKSEEASSPGLLLTSQAVHQRSSSISLKVSEADYTDEEKKVKYYRHPVMVTAKAQDSHAGVSQLTLSVYGQEQKE